MQTSTFSLVTELCLNLAKEVIDEHPYNKNILINKMRAQAFEVLLTNRTSEVTGDPSTLLIDIITQIYMSVESMENQTKGTRDNLNKLVEKAEKLIEINESFLSILKFLLCLANSSPPLQVKSKEQSYGLDMKTLITENLEHRSPLKNLPIFNSEIFDLSFPIHTEGDKLPDLHIFNKPPGAGLRHQLFQNNPPNDFSPSFESKIIDEYDLTNANWIMRNVHNEDSEPGTNIEDRKNVVHQDEGYVTPDQDLNIVKGPELRYIPWERLLEEKFKPVYCWDNLGSLSDNKESPFISQKRTSVEYISKLFHTLRTTSSRGTKTPSIMRSVSIEELEVAYKNLLIGVESTIFQYSNLKKSFGLKEGLHLEGSAATTLEEYSRDYIECGNSFKELSVVVQRKNLQSSKYCDVIYQSLCSSICHYMQCYRGIILSMPPMKSLLQTRDWLFTLQTQLQFLLKLCQGEDVPIGGALLAHLYNQVSLVNRRDLSFLFYYILQSCCTIYFRFLNRWIFEGMCDSNQNEFFIESCPLSEMPLDRKFWTRGFVLNRWLVPGFLKGLENDILVCGKTIALLRLCAPDDPICLQIKESFPGIQCCFNKTKLKEIEEQCQFYRDACKALCKQIFDEKSSEIIEDEDYYESIRIKSMERIKQVQENEKKLKIEKKHAEFEMLKKNMEDAEARKLEDKQKLLEEEQKIVKEGEECDYLNNLRREEEREKLLKYYSAVSEAADKRRKMAEWKIKRSELHSKRIEFYDKEKEWIESVKINYSKDDDTPVPGSGDHIGIKSDLKDSADIKSEIQRNILQNLEIGLTEGEVFDHNTSSKPQSPFDLKNLPKPADVPKDISGEIQKREWLMALDDAESVRQAAVKIKERNMFSDYNILTGETTTYESKFGEKILPTDDVVLAQAAHTLTTATETDFDKNLSTCDSDKSLVSSTEQNDPRTISHNSENNMFVKTFSDSPLNMSIQPFSECKQQEKSSKPNDVSTKSIPSTPLDRELDLSEFDITTVNRNLQMSVMIPLLTQLELANEAVLRLFLIRHNLLKHIKCLKEYFFMSDGEFSRNLTRSLFSELETVDNPIYLLNVSKLNAILRNAVGTTVDEEYTERLTFFVREAPHVFRLIDPRTLDCLSLRYRTLWPLNLVITEEATFRCDCIFRFLMQLHRVIWALEQDVYLLKDKKLSNSPQFRQIHLYRHIMTHFVLMLKNYITSVVLEECWIKFKDDFSKAKTLNEVYHSLVQYIKQVSFRCLVNKRSKKANDKLMELFSVILCFHEVLRASEWIEDCITGHYNNTGFSRLKHHFHSFVTFSRYLYEYCGKLSNGYQDHLKQFVTLLSVNDFYKTVD